jgi:hypothetical protein
LADYPQRASGKEVVIETFKSEDEVEVEAKEMLKRKALINRNRV